MSGLLCVKSVWTLTLPRPLLLDRKEAGYMIIRTKQASGQRQLESVERRLKKAQPDSPRARALEAEAHGLRNYLDVIRS
jgi:hypothetical protein